MSRRWDRHLPDVGDMVRIKKGREGGGEIFVVTSKEYDKESPRIYVHGSALGPVRLNDVIVVRKAPQAARPSAGGAR